MKQAAEKRSGSLGPLLATLMAVLFASIMAGWAAPDPAGPNAAAAPTQSVEIPLKPADLADGPADFDSASVRASWDPNTGRAVRAGSRIIYKSPSLRPSVLDTAIRGSLQ